MYCLWCNTNINSEVVWSNLFLPKKIDCLCEECIKGLQKIEESYCRKCHKLNTTDICKDCLELKKTGRDILERNISVYSYGIQIKEMVAKWKYRGDYELGFSFEFDFLKKFKETFKKELKSYVIVPIPLSEERERERCFNQAEMLARFLSTEIKTPLIRIHSEKQSKKTRMERLVSSNPFILKEPIEKTVILVDDIYTTGMTLRHAASLLKANGTPKVFAFTLIRG